jgi:hypothetical protein
VRAWTRIACAAREAGFPAMLAVAVAACEANMVVFPPDDTGEVVTLEVRVTDPDLAERLGWAPGAGVPGATVHARLEGMIGFHSFETDEDGVAELADVPSGRYWVWAERRFDSPAEGAPSVLAGGRLMRLRRGSSEPNEQIEVRGQQRGSLVISELNYHHVDVRQTGWETYRNHAYVELRNDSDSTIYLDGKIIGTGFNYGVEAAAWPCSETARWRNESRGIWAQSFQQFPGGGSDYPLPPGGVALIAEQAVDHSAIYPVLPDMSMADFQFYGSDRAMNPDVPTMLPIGLRVFPVGFLMLVLFHVPFIAEDVDVDALEKTHNLQGTFALFPRDKILDVSQIIGQTYLTPNYAGVCSNIVDVSLDGLPGFASPSYNVHPDAHMLAAQRKVLPDGTLQRTGVSAADWEVRERSPGRIP